MTCSPIRFGTANAVPLMTLTSTPASVTDIDWLKNEYAARPARWTDLASDIVIEFELPESRIGEYVALPGSNLIGLAEVQFELFRDTAKTERSLLIPFSVVAEPIPIGEYKVGIDPIGLAEHDSSSPAVYSKWYPPTIYISGRITIRHSAAAQNAAGDVRLRMLMIGTAVRLEKNFQYGHQIGFGDDPNSARTGGGSWTNGGDTLTGRQFDFSLQMMTEGDRQAIKRMVSDLKGQPFLISGFPEEKGWRYNDYTFLARFLTKFAPVHDSENVHSQTMTAVEV